MTIRRNYFVKNEFVAKFEVINNQIWISFIKTKFLEGLDCFSWQFMA
jgi:hypothetical protein